MMINNWHLAELSHIVMVGTLVGSDFKRAIVTDKIILFNPKEGWLVTDKHIYKVGKVDPVYFTHQEKHLEKLLGMING